ncbi:hypothetical protein CPB86DRAFT_238802 [Serendipita vermifera]|nr:hypothetical protein CPB86DRAFT_238802 [Serendipita vermifera]
MADTSKADLAELPVLATTGTDSSASSMHPTNTSRASSQRSKPKKFSYNPKHLLRLPHRLLHPPSKASLVQNNPTRKSPLIGTVRSFKLTPSYRVLLDNVLKGRHLPPLGRKEFEDFLYFKEYSAENLYFYFWFADYERAWTRWAHATHHTDATSPITSTTTTKSTRSTNADNASTFSSMPNSALAMSYARAKKTFFTPGSPWELNLPQKTLHQLLHPSKPHQGPPQHPHPSAFAAVKFEVDTYLNDSLTRFITQNGGNAGRNRAICAILIGLSIIVAGLSPIILTSLRSTATLPHYHPHSAVPAYYTHTWNQRLTRLAAIPGLWFGFMTMICGLHGVCIVIFLFGDARQLYPYELRRPDISSPIVSVKQAVLNPNLLANEKGEKRRSVVDKVDTNREEGVTEFVKLPSKGRRGRSGTATTATAASEATDHAKVYEESYDLDGDDESQLKRRVDTLSYPPQSPTTATATPTSKAGFFPFNEQPTPTSTRPYHTPSSSSSHPTTNYSCPDYPDSPVYFDFDAMPLPPGMKFPPGWNHEQSKSRQIAMGTATTSASGSVEGSMEDVDVDVETIEKSAPKSRMEKVKRGVSVWGLDTDRTMLAPLTAVSDPVITRTQWVIFMRSAAVALVLSLIVACASLAVS